MKAKGKTRKLISLYSSLKKVIAPNLIAKAISKALVSSTFDDFILLKRKNITAKPINAAIEKISKKYWRVIISTPNL